MFSQPQSPTVLFVMIILKRGTGPATMILDSRQTRHGTLNFMILPIDIPTSGKTSGCNPVLIRASRGLLLQGEKNRF